jgi:hypothetical protein
MRWAYGLTRVFIDHWKKIWFGRNFSIQQKIVISFLTLSYIVCPFILAMAVSGQVGWFFGNPRPILLEDIIKFFSTLFATSGFLFLGLIGLKKEGRISTSASFVASTFLIGICLAFFNTIAFLKAIAGKRMGWFRTPKFGTKFILALFKHLFKKKNFNKLKF